MRLAVLLSFRYSVETHPFAGDSVVLISPQAAN